MEELNLLESRLRQLLSLYNALQADHQEMQKKIVDLTRTVETQRSEISELEKELNLSQMAQAGAQLDSEKKDHFRQQLNKVISELEKNIELLQ